MRASRHVPWTEPPGPLATAVEFRPNLLDRTSGLIGKLATSKGGPTSYRQPDGYNLRSLLDHYETGGQQPELELWTASPDDPDCDAGPLLALLNSSPRLAKPIFLPGLREIETRKVCSIEAGYSEWAFLPVRNFVLAPGLEDWNRGRSDGKFDSTTSTYRNSRRTIRTYARKSTPAAPIDLVSANVQPNGIVLYQLLRDGAHRLAAAHLRGDPEIAVDSIITVNRIAQNLLPLLQTELQLAD